MSLRVDDVDVRDWRDEEQYNTPTQQSQLLPSALHQHKPTTQRHMFYGLSYFTTLKN